MKRPALRGTVLALLSAAAFGVTTPLVQRFGRGVGSFATAALLYFGAAIAGSLGTSSSEARPKRAHAARLFAVAVVGAGLAPALLAWGLARTSGIGASLMLNLEAVFTVVLARIVWGEHVGRRVAIAACLLAGGGALLVVDAHAGGAAARAAQAAQAGQAGRAGAARMIGLAAIAGAALAWACDNTFARPLASLDPARVVAYKGAIGASLSAGAAVALGEAWPSLGAAAGLAVVGGVGYGASLRLYIRAQRELGAGRTASVFASAPFCGAAVAWALGEPGGPLAVAGAGAMIVGLALHLTEEHGHAHVHAELTHDHAHRHDDGHHDHAHDPLPAGEHTHEHTHARVTHDHAHVPDFHHDHDHDHDPQEDPHDRHGRDDHVH